MKKRFKAIKRSKKNRKIFFLIILFFIFLFLKYIIKNKIPEEKNQLIIDTLMNNGLNYFEKYHLSFEQNPISLKNDIKENTAMVVDNEKTNVVSKSSELKPLVYIYNTHQTEEYSDENLSPYNIVPNVVMAAKMLKEKLENRNIGVVVEEKSVTDVVNANSWPYHYTYRVSRSYMESAKKENPSLIFFIDLHRDGALKSVTTTYIEDVPYAKIMFLVSKNHDNYENVLKVTENINERIKNYNNTLTRGIYFREKQANSGAYNQDFDTNTLLIELGAQYNTLEEVNNTLEVLADAISGYIKENI